MFWLPPLPLSSLHQICSVPVLLLKPTTAYPQPGLEQGGSRARWPAACREDQYQHNDLCCLKCKAGESPLKLSFCNHFKPISHHEPHETASLLSDTISCACVCVCLGTYVKSHCTKPETKGQCEECDYSTFTEHENGLSQCFKCTQCRLGNSARRLRTIDQNGRTRKINTGPFRSAPNIKSVLTRCFSCSSLRSGNCKGMHSHRRYYMSVQIREILRSWPSMWSVQEVFKVSLCKTFYSKPTKAD